VSARGAGILRRSERANHKVGIGILDYRGLRHLARVPRADAAVMLIVLFVTVFFDLLIAVGVGMLMASLLFMRRMSEVVEDGIELERLSAFQDEQQWPDEHIPPELERNVLVKRITGPLFFGFATAFQKSLAELPDARFVIIRLKRVPFIDQSGVYALDEAVRQLEERGVTVLLTGMRGQPLDLVHRLRVVPQRIPEQHTFRNFDEGVAYAQKRLAAEMRSQTV
jgi:SulP family sulfate permease